MKSYKIAVVTPTTDGYLDIWTGDGSRVPVMLPQALASDLRHGTRLQVHYNRDGRTVACSFGGNMVLMGCPLTREEVSEFVNGIKDVYQLSLDKMLFKYALRRSLRRVGMIPTGRLVTDVMSLSYINNLSNVR